MSKFRSALFALVAGSLAGCQGNVQSVNPAPNAAPLINVIQSGLSQLPDSYFTPLTSELVKGVQASLYNLKPTSKVFFAANGKRYIKTEGDLMVEIGRYSEEQAEAVNAMLRPVLTSSLVTNAVIAFSNEQASSELYTSFEQRQLATLADVCLSTFTSSNNLSVRANTLLSPENFNRHTELKANQTASANAIQSHLASALSSQLPAAATKENIKSSTEFCLSMDLELGDAIRKATQMQVKKLARSSGSERAPLERLIALTKLSDKEVAERAAKKPRSATSDISNAPSLVRCKAENGDLRIVAEKTCTNLLRGTVVSP